jgi:Flp pilus assembly secretin CpaC
MKTMNFILRILTLLLLGIPLLMAQEEFKIESAKSNILVEMQIVAIPRDIATPLIRDLMEKEKIEAAYLRIQELLEKKTAKLIGWPMVTTQSGQRGVIEAIQEFRYATEYSPGVVDFYVPEGAGAAVGPYKKLPPEIDQTQFNGTPTAFETRNIGVTFEVQPTLSADEKTIAMTIVPQHIRLNKMTKSTVEKEKTHEKIVVEQPEFDTMKTYTTLTVKSGERILMGVYPTSEPPDHMELFILHAEVRKVQ